MVTIMGLHWDASYAIVVELMRLYPEVDVESVGLEQLHQMIIALPDFIDDPNIANDPILEDILGEWYEEVSR